MVFTASTKCFCQFEFDSCILPVFVVLISFYKGLHGFATKNLHEISLSFCNLPFFELVLFFVALSDFQLKSNSHSHWRTVQLNINAFFIQCCMVLTGDFTRVLLQIINEFSIFASMFGLFVVELHILDSCKSETYSRIANASYVFEYFFIS